MPNSQPQELIAAQIIDDPFSMEFMETANTLQVSADSLASLPKRRVRVARNKFVLHKDLKARLNKLLASNCNEQAKTVAEDILNLKYVPLEGKYCNYLGLSQADYTKISYLDKDREERLAGQETTMEMIHPGTIVKIYMQKGRRRDRSAVPENPTTDDLTYTYQLKLTSRHLGDRVYPIDRVEDSIAHFSQEFWNNEPAQQCFLDFKNTYLSEDSEILRIRNSRTRGTGRFEVGRHGLHIHSNNWERVIAVEFENTSVTIKEVWNFKKRYHTSIGKIVRRLFGDKYSDREVTAFAEAYASLITVSNPLYDFAIIEGEAIKDAYYEDNYYQHSGTLGNSCMRYYNCQRYFEIYTKYPEKVKMAVLKRSGKIAARCIMWNIEGKFMFDRIYFTTDETHNLLKNTLMGAGYETLYQAHRNFSLNIDLTGIQHFPYVDTLCNYDPNRMILTNQHLHDEYWQFRSTGGCFTRYNSSERLECCICGDHVDEDNSTYITAGDHEDNYTCSSCYIYCEIDDSYITIEDDSVETYDGDTVLTARSVTLNNGQYAHQDDQQLREYENGFGYFILDEDFYFTNGFSFYHKNDPNIPEDAYDSEEAYRRAQEQIRSQLEIARQQLVTSSGNSTYIHTSANGFISSNTSSMYTTFIVPPIEQVRETLEELSLIQPNTVTEEVELEMEEEVIQEQIQENNEREFLI